MKKLLTALALACSISTASAIPVTFTNGSAGFSAQHAYTKDLITDVYTFELETPHSLTAALISIALTYPGQLNKPIMDFDFSKITLSGAGQVYDLIPILFSTDYLEFWKIDNVNLAAGDYTLRVEGHVSEGAVAGSYGGNINIADLPVPEPGSLALFGAAFLALAASRKRNATEDDNRGMQTLSTRR